MSRIDQAFTRARRPSSLTVPDEKVFASPWDVNESLQAMETPGAAVPAESVEGDGDAGRGTEEAPRFIGPGLHAIRDENRPAAPDAAPIALAERFRSGWKERLTIARDADPWLVEQYRKLVAILLERQSAGRLRSVMVTSAGVNDGKTLTALNLALVLSESYRHRVLLIDADLRRPAVGYAAGLRTSKGLNEAIASRGGTVSVVQLTDRLCVLPASGPDPDPVSGLASVRMQQLLEDATARFQWVVIDSPPAALVTDAGLLSAMVDAAILVVRAGETPYAAIQAAIDSVGRDRILGVVLNGFREDLASTHRQYYGGMSHDEGSSRSGSRTTATLR